MNEIRYGRKRSGIIKELSAKIEDWLNSIDDEAVRTLARKNTIVTGGSIASMLLGERINDFDVYFRDMGTTIAVARYYCQKLMGIKGFEYDVRVVDATNIKGRTEARVVNYVQSKGVYDAGCVSEPEDGAYNVSFVSTNSISLTNKVQLITRFYGEPEKIHDNYDFQHAMCYWDHGKKRLVLPAEALECLLSRTLVYRGSLYPIASIFRMKKFLTRGWRISAGEQLKIMWQISEVDLTDIHTLVDQLTGVDLLYMRSLIDALSTVDAAALTAEYVTGIIDRVFSGEDEAPPSEDEFVVFADDEDE